MGGVQGHWVKARRHITANIVWVTVRSAESLTQTVRECACVSWREKHVRGPRENIILICVCIYICTYAAHICAGNVFVSFANTSVCRTSVQCSGCMGVISYSRVKQLGIMWEFRWSVIIIWERRQGQNVFRGEEHLVDAFRIAEMVWFLLPPLFTLAGCLFLKYCVSLVFFWIREVLGR